MVVLLILGSIFTVGGIGIFILGHLRGVPNSVLWGLFPILHGMHEFAEYFIEEGNDALIIEQMEVLFAIGSSIVLLMACIEFLGVVPSPFGKLAGIVSYGIITYFVLISPEVFEAMEHETFTWGFLSTSYFRFLFGFILVLASLSAILFSFLYLKYEDKRGKMSVGSEITRITLVSLALLLIFAVFEGFSSENAVFITLRGITGILFLVVPAYVVFSSKLGLQRLLITSKAGEFITGYDFGREEELDDDSAILTGSFIAAISSFSQEDSQIGGLSGITTTQGRYMIVALDQYLVTLLTRTSTRQLDQALISFTELVPGLVTIDSGSTVVNRSKFKATIQQELGQFA